MCGMNKLPVPTPDSTIAGDFLPSGLLLSSILLVCEFGLELPKYESITGMGDRGDICTGDLGAIGTGDLGEDGIGDLDVAARSGGDGGVLTDGGGGDFGSGGLIWRMGWRVGCVDICGRTAGADIIIGGGGGGGIFSE